MNNARTTPRTPARSSEHGLRDEHARLTRRRILDAAYASFVEGDGYSRTTIAALARAAEVSPQTIYNTFGSKATLLKSVYDVRLAGDDEPSALADRSEVTDLLVLSDAADFLRGYARLGARLVDRLGALMAMVVEGAAAGDPDLRELVATAGRERLIGATGAVDRVVALGALRPGLSATTAAELVWTLNSFEVWDLLVRQRGWTSAAYADYVGQAMVHAILPSSHDTDVPAIPSQGRARGR